LVLTTATRACDLIAPGLGFSGFLRRHGARWSAVEVDALGAFGERQQISPIARI
jgi:hypothetical protein